MKNIVIVIAVVTLLMFSTALYSQRSGSKDQQGKPPQQLSVEDRVSELTTALSLTDEQVTQLTVIMENHEKEMLALREDSSTDRSANMDKMKELRESFENEVKEILTEEQQTKFEELSKNQRPGNRREKSPRE